MLAYSVGKGSCIAPSYLFDSAERSEPRCGTPRDYWRMAAGPLSLHSERICIYPESEVIEHTRDPYDYLTLSQVRDQPGYY
jgi:hypothetical protein